MAAGLTPLKDSNDVVGKHRIAFIDVAGDNSYATGGYAIAPAAAGMRQIYGMTPVGGNAASAAYLAQWDINAQKLRVMYPTGGGVAPAALADPLITAGAVAMTSTAANGSGDITAGRAKEVANATDLSTLSFRMMVFGE